MPATMKPGSAEAVQRRALVLQLRARGMSFPAIAEAEVQRGYPRRSFQAVTTDYQRALKAANEGRVEVADLAVALESERLDEAMRAVQSVIAGAQTGRCAACGRAPDPKLVLAAADRLIAISARRGKLEGIDKMEPETPKPAADPLDKAKKSRDTKLRAV